MLARDMCNLPEYYDCSGVDVEYVLHMLSKLCVLEVISETYWEVMCALEAERSLIHWILMYPPWC